MKYISLNITFRIFVLRLKIIYASLIRDKELKDDFRKELYTYTGRLGVSYNLFDGEELLEASIKSVRGSVNYINVVYQETSNFGDKATPGLFNMLTELKRSGLIDSIIKYTPDFSQTPQQNEVNKRDIGMRDCLANGCRYFISMDTDEFYKKEQFEYAKNVIFKRKICASACMMYSYIKSPLYRFETPATTLFVPFIFKINRSSRFKAGSYSPCTVDPTRMINGKKKVYIFNTKQLVMHHMSGVRKDLNKKFRNSTYNQWEKNTERLKFLNHQTINYHYPDDYEGYEHDQHRIIKTDNIFGITGFSED